MLDVTQFYLSEDALSWNNIATRTIHIHTGLQDTPLQTFMWCRMRILGHTT